MNEPEPWLERCNSLLKNHSAVAKWLLVLSTVAVFGGMLRNSFVYDDGRQVLENPFVRNPHLWWRIFTGPVWSFLGLAAETNFYRPLHILSHWLVWRVAGADPGAFHLYQLVFYVLNALLVYRLGRDLLRNHLTAFAGALVWAWHPLHVEPVCWIAGVPDCGCGLLYLLAFVLFLRGEKTPQHRWAWHALGALVYFLALLFKEMGISMPLLLAVYWFCLSDQESWWRKGLRWWPYAAAAAMYIGLRIIVLGHVSHATHLWRITPRGAAAAVGLLGQHTKLFFWPTDLNDFRNFDLSASLRSPWPWITLLVLVLTVVLRKRDSALCFLILWWPVTLIPCLDVRQLSYPLLAERFSYLPSVGLSLAMAQLVLKTLPEGFGHRLAAGLRTQAPSLPGGEVDSGRPGARAAGRLAQVLAPAFGLALVLFAVQDLRAVPRWRDNDTLWNYSYKVEPKSALVHVHRALDLEYRNNDLGGATQEFETAIKLNRVAFVELPTVTYDCLIGLGEIASLQGRADEAVVYFRKAVALTPRYSAAYDVLGSVYFPRGDYVRAAEYFRQAVHVNPFDMGARFFLGTCLLKLGQPAQAAEQFHAAREVDPTYLQAFAAEATALEAAGDKAGAARVRSEKPSQ